MFIVFWVYHPSFESFHGTSSGKTWELVASEMPNLPFRPSQDHLSRFLPQSDGIPSRNRGGPHGTIVVQLIMGL